MEIVLLNAHREFGAAKEMFMTQLWEEKNRAQDGTYKTVSTMQKQEFCGLGKTRDRSSDEPLTFALNCVSFHVYFSLQFQFFLYLISYFKI